MKFTVGSLIFPVYCCCFIIAKSMQLDEPISLNLKLVATANKKSFFCGRFCSKTGSFCAGLGMKLADITSQSKADALKLGFSTSDFYGKFWSYGRDSHERRQYTWNTTGYAISKNYPDFRTGSGLGYQTCLYYQYNPNGTAPSNSLYFNTCSSKWGTLCNT